MRNIVVLPSFDRSVKRFSVEEKKRLAEALRDLNHFGLTGKISKGFGLTKIDHDKYEFRVSLDLRVALKTDGANLYLVMAGNHDDVRRYLRNYR